MVDDVSNVAGRLRHFFSAWAEITSDSVVLSWLQGYEIPFSKKVFQYNPPREIKISNVESRKTMQLVNELIIKGVIQKCSPEKGQFISRSFLVPKPDGSSRFILNLKELNQFIEPVHFKLEDGRTAARLLFQNCVMATLDLKDAYYMIPIHKDYRKYLRFFCNSQLFEFTCLPFGLCTAPYVFTKLMKPAISYLRGLGLTIIIYIDDILFIEKSVNQCSLHLETAKSLFSKLGLLINYKKCQLTPEIRCKFLGFIFNSEKMQIELPESKREKIRSLVKEFKLGEKCTIQRFAEMLGFLVSCCPAVKYGPVYTKACERSKFKALQKNLDNYNSKFIVDCNAFAELEWWRKVGALNNNPIRHSSYSLTISSDASKTGWDISCNKELAHGFWKEHERLCSINFLELKAAFFGLKCFANNYKNCQVLLLIDNTTAISYINRMGGVQFENLNLLAKEIWRWCEERDIWVFASYIPSKENFKADAESRSLDYNTEFELTKDGFQKIVMELGKPKIDLFASRANSKCNRYISWKIDPHAISIDAFTVSWKEYFFYAFPPFSIIIRALQKIRQERSIGIVVVPYWPSQPWFPLFQSMRISDPVYLKSSSYISVPFNREKTGFWKDLILVAGILSGGAAR